MTEENQVTEVKKRVITNPTPQKYIKRKTDLMTSILESEDSRKVVEAIIPSNYAITKYFLANHDDKVLEYVKQDSALAARIVREVYLNNPILLENLYKDLPVEPLKCKVCGNLPEKAGDVYMCSGATCLVKLQNVEFSSIADWNEKIGAK